MDCLGYAQRFRLPEGCTDERVLEALEVTHGLDSSAVVSALQIFGLSKEFAADIVDQYEVHCSRDAGNMSASGSLVVDGGIREVPMAVTVAASGNFPVVGESSRVSKSSVRYATVVSTSEVGRVLTFTVGSADREVRLKVQSDRLRYLYDNKECYKVRSEWHNTAGAFVVFDGMEFVVDLTGVPRGRQEWVLERVDGMGPYAEHTGIARLMAGRMMARPAQSGGMIEGLRAEQEVLTRHGLTLDDAAQMLVEELSGGLDQVAGYVDVGGYYCRVAPRAPGAGVITYSCVERVGQSYAADSVLWYGHLSSVVHGESNVYRVELDSDVGELTSIGIGDEMDRYGLHYFDLSAGELYLYVHTVGAWPDVISGLTDGLPVGRSGFAGAEPVKSGHAPSVMEYLPWRGCTDAGVLRGLNEPTGLYVVPQVCGGLVSCQFARGPVKHGGKVVGIAEPLLLRSGDTLRVGRQSVELQVVLPRACQDGKCGNPACDIRGGCAPKAIARFGSSAWCRPVTCGGSVLLDSPADAVAAWRHTVDSTVRTVSGVWSSLRVANLGTHGPLPSSAVLVVMYAEDKARVMSDFGSQFGAENCLLAYDELGGDRYDHVWLIDYAISRARDRYRDAGKCSRVLQLHRLTFKYVRSEPGGMLHKWISHVDVSAVALVSRIPSKFESTGVVPVCRGTVRVRPWADVGECVENAALIFFGQTAEREFRLRYRDYVPRAEGMYMIEETQGKHFDKVVLCISSRPTALERSKLDDAAYCSVAMSRHWKLLTYMGEARDGGLLASKVLASV